MDHDNNNKRESVREHTVNEFQIRSQYNDTMDKYTKSTYDKKPCVLHIS